MKKVKGFIITDVVILALKVLGYLACNSLSLLASGLFELMVFVYLLLGLTKDKNKKIYGIITAVMGFVFCLLGISICFGAIVFDVKKVSLLLILFLIAILLIRYCDQCYTITMNCNKGKGFLAFAGLTSNIDFIMLVIALISAILTKLNKLWSLFKYADILGAIIIVSFVLFKGIKLILRSFNYLDDEKLVFPESYMVEIKGRKEVSHLEELSVRSFGGIKTGIVRMRLMGGISFVDANSFVMMLQDYLLKSVDCVQISLCEGKKTPVVMPKVGERGKSNARNSRSRNRKTSSKGKNTRKNNKKN